jgi:chromosome partitioning protein
LKTLALYSVKGGVGKTAAAVNLAYLAAQSGQRTLLWDLDPQAASTFYLRLAAKRGGARGMLEGTSRLRPLVKASDYEFLDVLPARFSFRKADGLVGAGKQARAKFAQLIAPLEKHYDLLIFDCAPGLSLVSECVLDVADGVVVPVIPTPLSVRTLQMLTKHCKAEGIGTKRLWPFYSMVDIRRTLHREICESPEMLPVKPLNVRVPYASQVERMGTERAPLAAFAASSAAAQAYAALWAAISNRLAKKG